MASYNISNVLLKIVKVVKLFFGFGTQSDWSLWPCIANLNLTLVWRTINSSEANTVTVMINCVKWFHKKACLYQRNIVVYT